LSLADPYRFNGPLVSQGLGSDTSSSSDSWVDVRSVRLREVVALFDRDEAEVLFDLCMEGGVE
jgi:hypothetical protein